MPTTPENSRETRRDLRLPTSAHCYWQSVERQRNTEKPSKIAFHKPEASSSANARQAAETGVLRLRGTDR